MMRVQTTPWCVAVLLAAGCGGDIGVQQTSVCDGLQQPGEDFVDEPFDRDGDGFFDGQNVDCAKHYEEDDLDCNDGDENVNPNATEVTCDGVDNDCDDETPDNVNCTSEPGDYSGTYSLDTTVVYSCAGGAVSISFSEVDVFDAQPNIEVSGGGGQPGTMSGSLNGTTGVFSANVNKPGGCDENYTISGQFTNVDSFTGEFEAAFSGGYCADCTNQEWDVTGTRVE